MVAFAENKILAGGGGYNADAETQNYYVRNRYYLPTLGRWLTRDPIGYQGGINLYAYVQSSPVGNVDAAGLVEIHGTLASVEAYAGFGGGVDVKYKLDRERCHCNSSGYGRLSGTLAAEIHLGLGIGEGLDILGYHEELLLRAGPQFSFGTDITVTKTCRGSIHASKTERYHFAPVALGGGISVAKVFSLTASGQIGGTLADTIIVTNTSIEVKVMAKLDLSASAHLQIGFLSTSYTLPFVKRPGINESATIFDHKWKAPW